MAAIEFKDDKSCLFDAPSDVSDAILYADFKNRVVRTNCGEFCYDYDISFDDLFMFIDYVKNMDNLYNGDGKD